MSTQTPTGDFSNPKYTIGSITSAGLTSGYNTGYWDTSKGWGQPLSTTWITDNTTASPTITATANIYPFSQILEKLTRLEERMGMIERNLLLETKYKELKELGDRYKELEKDLLEKEKIVEILKK